MSAPASPASPAAPAAAAAAAADCFLAVLNPARGGYFEGPTEAERAAVAEHFEYLKALRDRGVVVLAGRATNGFCGIVVFRAPDAAAARRLVDHDPAVRAGVFMAGVHPFRLALLAPDPAGTSR